MIELGKAIQIKPIDEENAGKVEAVEQEMRRCGAHTVQSGVQANNPSAIRFWHRMGYRITGGPDLMPDSTVCYSLEKKL